MVLAGAYYATKVISKKSAPLYKGKNLKVIERINLDKDKSFVLLKKGETTYLIGITAQGMTVIDTYTEEFSEEATVDFQSSNVNKEHSIGKTFETVLSKIFKGGGSGKNE